MTRTELPTPRRRRGRTTCAAVFSALFAALVFLPSIVSAQGDPNYVIKVTDANTTQGQIFDLEVQLDIFGDEVQGWSFGICHVDQVMELLSVVDSTVTATSKNGGPPDFNAVGVYDNGFTVGLLICFTGCAALSPGVGYPLNIATYQTLAPGPLTIGVSPCETLGSPVVPVKVVVDGTTNAATTETGVVQIFFGTPPTVHIHQGGQGFSVYDPSNGLTSASVPVFVDESELSPGFPTPVTGFEMAIRYNPGVMSLAQVDMGSALAALNGGSGPDFFQSTIVAEGVMIEALMDNGDPLLAPDPAEIALLSFDANPTPLMFNPFGITESLEFDDTIAPGAANTLTSTAPGTGLLQLDAGTVRFVPKNQFIRGDANNDGSIEISDVTCILDGIFFGGDLTCEDAADTNDDQFINVADAVGLLEFLFLFGIELPDPFPGCGFDTNGPGDCLVYNGCP